MTHATLIYPHQLYKKHPSVAADRAVFLVEDPLFFTEFPIHRSKLLFHRLTMQAYGKQLENSGHRVSTLNVNDIEASSSIFTKLAKDGFTDLHITDTTDDWLEQRITAAAQDNNLTLHRAESPLFLLSKDDAMSRYEMSGRHMAKFYKTLRQDWDILVEPSGKPVGDKWSFDQDNRKKLPRNITLPPDIVPYGNAQTIAAETWLDGLDGEFYGKAVVWLPTTHASAKTYLDDFIQDRLHNFGTYEDAITSRHTRLFHSAISPLLNIGLLTPDQVLDSILAHAHDADIALNNLEGFIRQLIGWREFIRAAYEVDGRAMRTSNFWDHNRDLPDGIWDASTGLPPLDHTIKTALDFGYAHHIERLMVQGNFLLLTQTNPDQVYRWFMALYVDAYDWVMVPNVYGMSQFADGGSFATKPYISGANYIRKMSDFESGPWEDTWTALYWNFISENKQVFENNHRMSMMPRMLDKMKGETRQAHLKNAKNFLKS